MNEAVICQCEMCGREWKSEFEESPADPGEFQFDCATCPRCDGNRFTVESGWKEEEDVGDA